MNNDNKNKTWQILLWFLALLSISGTLCYRLQYNYKPEKVEVVFDIKEHNNNATIETCPYIDEIKKHVHESELNIYFDTIKYYSSELDIPYEWLIYALKSESNFYTLAKNKKGSGAFGLIQFMPFIYNSKEFGNYTERQFEQLGWEKQMFFVYKYLKGRINDIENRCELKTFTDFYMVIFYPIAVCEGNDYVIAKSPSKRYKQNIGCDIYTTNVKPTYNKYGNVIPNPDNIITKRDMEVWLYSRFPNAFKIKK